MKHNNRKNARIAVLASVVALAVIGGSYAYAHQQEKSYLANEQARYEGKAPAKTAQAEAPAKKETPSQKSVEALAQAFSEKREQASVLGYLAYIKQQGSKPTVTTIQTMGAKRDWVKEGLEQALSTTDLTTTDINYQTVDAVRLNSSDMNAGQVIEKVQAQKPQLVVIPFSNAADVRDGLATDQSAEEALILYQNIRLAVPDANVIFLSQPAESEALNTNEAFIARIAPFGEQLTAQQLNWLNLATGELAPDLQYSDDGLRDSTLDQLRDAVAKAFQANQWRLTLGYKGDNDGEIQSLKAASDSRVAASQAAAQARAESQAAAQAEEASRLEAESRAVESSLAQSRQQEQQNQQPANGTEQQQSNQGQGVPPQNPNNTWNNQGQY